MTEPNPLSPEYERQRLFALHWNESRVPNALEEPHPEYLAIRKGLQGIQKLITAIEFHGPAGPAAQQPRPGAVLLGICGNAGTGKSTLGVELMRLAAPSVTVRYTTMENYVRAADVRHADWESLCIEFQFPKLLVIDDVYHQDRVVHRKIFEQLVVDRCNALRWTIVIANEPAENFGATIGPSLTDRLSAPIIALTGKSHRKP